MTYGEQLREWMTAQGYTVRGLAATIGVSPAAVNEYRTGRCLPGEAVEIVIAELSRGTVAIPRCDACHQRIRRA
jgi:transcriptional regulator with XRE-family HTH domain